MYQMQKVKFLSVTFICISMMLWGCSSSTDQKTAYISGDFSWTDSANASADSLNIGLTIVKQDSANALPDTLFNAITNSQGQFTGTVNFDERRSYKSLISRNEKDIGSVSIILADGDSVKLSGSLPNLEQSFSVSSAERKAMNDYQKLNKSYRRVQKYAQAGVLKGDSLRQEVEKWSGLYWDVMNEHKGTMGGELSGQKSITLLNSIDEERMMSRLREVQYRDGYQSFAANLGSQYLTNEKGLDPALAYLDSLYSKTADQDEKMQVGMQRIKLLYDSARVKVAQKRLKAFKKEFPKEERSQKWVESMDYDLNYMSPGDQIPDFEFAENGKTISRDSLLGSPYILEVTRLSNKLYQQQFERTMVIQSIYKNYGLEVVTLPLDDSQITVDAFFDERMKPWPVADAQTFDRQKLIKKFNVRMVPTRFLINSDGRIIRKYIGKEYQDVIKGIQKVIKEDK